MAQRMEKHSVADPPLLLNQLILHDGDMSSGAAEADPPELEPETQCFRERRPLRRSEPLIRSHSRSAEQEVDKRIPQKTVTIMML